MTDDRREMSVHDFRTMGYLQELNRQFLHPLGLALSIEYHPDGSVRFGPIWDGRDDPAGIAFVEGVGGSDRAKYDYVQHQIEARLDARTNALGYWIQPPPAER